MKKNRLLYLLLALVMLLGIVASCGDPTEPAQPDTPPVENPPETPTPAPDDPAPTPPPPEPPSSFNSKTARDTLVVGVPEMNADFVDGWGNSSYDVFIKTLLGNYAYFYCTAFYDEGGQFNVNPTVVKDVNDVLDGDGNKVYTWTLHEDLRWNNGEPITAKDYVASILFYAGPAFAAAGGSSEAGDGLIGYADYKRGYLETGEEDEDGNPIPGDPVDTFAAIKLLGDYQFSVTIDADALPYFWELSYVSVTPVYSAGWFPGVDIISDNNGARFSADITRFAETISDVERKAPTVTCGPYNFVSYDGSTVNLQRNPYFKGDPYGDLPYFEYIIQMEVSDETDVDLAISGDVDLITGVIEGSKIEAAKSSEFAGLNEYLRNGYGFIGFPCDWGVTSDPNVRWAIAHMIDRNSIIDHVLEGYGGLVDSGYGMAQWTYAARRREVAARLTPIVYNLDKANEFLDQTEWKFEADGTTPFNAANANPQGTYMRHNSSGEMLVVRHYSASSSVGGAIEAETIKNSPLIGMRYELTHGDFDTLLNNYYDGYDLPESERLYNAFNLATNFAPADDKYWSHHSDLVGTWMNAEQLADDELDRLIMAMRSLDPEQTDEYADLWVDYLVRWQELLPQLPIYSNQYFDIYNSVVTQVPTNPFWHYAEAICRIAKHP